MRDDVTVGVLEFSEAADAKRCADELDGRRMQGGTLPMRVFEGDS